jgi:hypothetical protein
MLKWLKLSWEETEETRFTLANNIKKDSAEIVREDVKQGTTNSFYDHVDQSVTAGTENSLGSNIQQDKGRKLSDVKPVVSNACPNGCSHPHSVNRRTENRTLKRENCNWLLLRGGIIQIVPCTATIFDQLYFPSEYQYFPIHPPEFSALVAAERRVELGEKWLLTSCFVWV